VGEVIVNETRVWHVGGKAQYAPAHVLRGVRRSDEESRQLVSGAAACGPRSGQWIQQYRDGWLNERAMGTRIEDVSDPWSWPPEAVAK
jgi:hypothetical protein